MASDNAILICQYKLPIANPKQYLGGKNHADSVGQVQFWFSSYPINNGTVARQLWVVMSS